MFGESVVVCPECERQSFGIAPSEKGKLEVYCQYCNHLMGYLKEVTH